jgi:ribosome-associated protein
MDKDFIKDKLNDSKIEDIEIINVSKKTSLMDYIVIGTGRSVKHISSAMDNLRTSLKENFNFIAKPASNRGGESEWIVLDLDSIFVHLFTKETRNEYKLEDLWKKEIK